jgi:hypothetical protein
MLREQVQVVDGEDAHPRRSPAAVAAYRATFRLLLGFIADRK